MNTCEICGASTDNAQFCDDCAKLFGFDDVCRKCGNPDIPARGELCRDCDQPSLSDFVGW